MKDNPSKEKTPVRVFREEMGITRVELSRRIGLSERSLADIELGKSLPKLETAVAMSRELKKSLKQIVKALGLDVNDIPDDVPKK